MFPVKENLSLSNKTAEVFLDNKSNRDFHGIPPLRG